ncbi:B-cell antigen receptor complex-associated protein beta chain [Hyla sarda]|uniref:B-cell antigen receptor complex-associated protein beta chain n=1 Tax=Hyla sarda TaxID=327740 RepID=UPI0024C3019A|nr:B-cell antigen receptor complex-associated protein beta chain [Hyla sarda]
MRIVMLPRSTLRTVSTLCVKMTARQAILCAFSIAVFLLDQGCCARSNSSEESDMVQYQTRFIAVRKGRTVNILCGCWSMQFPVQRNVSWYRGHQDGSVITYLNLEPHITTNGISLKIQNVQRKDMGIYFCTYNTTKKIKQPHCGTELMIVGSANAEMAKSRNTMKDTIIVIQTILIVLFLVVPVNLLRGMNRKRNLKMEDHTYEGLEAYQTATYEDIQTVRVLAAKTMEGEHPCLE